MLKCNAIQSCRCGTEVVEPPVSLADGHGWIAAHILIMIKKTSRQIRYNRDWQTVAQCMIAIAMIARHVPSRSIWVPFSSHAVSEFPRDEPIPDRTPDTRNGPVKVSLRCAPLGSHWHRVMPNHSKSYGSASRERVGSRRSSHPACCPDTLAHPSSCAP